MRKLLKLGFTTLMLRLAKSILAFNSKPIKIISEFKYNHSITMISVPMEP